MAAEPKTRLRRAGTVGAAVAGVLAVFVAGILVGGHPRATGLTDLPPGLRELVLGANDDPTTAEVLQILEDEYYVEVDSKRLRDASVDALVGALNDPYTTYLDPEEYAQLLQATDGTFVGVGMGVRAQKGGAVVSEVYENSPAQRAGVATGDVIVSVDGKDVRSLSLEDLVGRIRGPEGTRVTVGVRRGDRPLEFAMTRAEIPVRLVSSRVETVNGEKVGYTRLARFDPGAAAQLRRAVGDLTRQGVTGIVLDLRGDPGGRVNEAVKVAGVFLPRGSDVVTIEGLHSDRRTLRTESGPATRVPVVVLVDRNSASASEIVAGALRDEGRAPIVGTRTFGKALVQTTRPLRNGGALRYTSARYRTPADVDINKTGLKPDVQAVDKPATPRVDEALQAALRAAAEAS